MNLSELAAMVLTYPRGNQMNHNKKKAMEERAEECLNQLVSLIDSWGEEGEQSSITFALLLSTTTLMFCLDGLSKPDFMDMADRVFDEQKEMAERFRDES